MRSAARPRDLFQSSNLGQFLFKISRHGTTLTVTVTVTVTDTGFGNVLDGLELNDTATALIGTAQVAVPLSDAATAVRAFRTCTEAGLA